MLISKKRFRRILSIFLAVLLLLVASGCGNPVRKGVENMVKDAISDAIEKGMKMTITVITTIQTIMATAARHRSFIRNS